MIGTTVFSGSRSQSSSANCSRVTAYTAAPALSGSITPSQSVTLETTRANTRDGIDRRSACTADMSSAVAFVRSFSRSRTRCARYDEL
jgi:hypothetical protein